MSRSLAAIAVKIACVVLALASGRVFAAPEQFPGLDAKWRLYRSPNFELYSRASDGFSRELLRNMETMRATFFHFLALPPRDTADVSIYVFKSTEKFRAYSSPQFEGKDNLLGEYRVFPDRDVISLATDEGIEVTKWIIYADLTKSLLLGTGGRPPSWLAQGMSMFFGTFSANTKSCIVGEADSFRSRLVRDNPTMDIEWLFRVEEGRSGYEAQETSNIFHAKAWVLLHYWYCGQSAVPVAEVNRFIHFMLQPGNAADEALVRAKFEEIFKMDYAEMNRLVSRYMRAGRFRTVQVATPALPSPDSYSMRAMDVGEMRERLAELLLRSRRDAMAKFVLIEALRGPRAARAAEALGADAAAEGDADRAQEYWRRAIEAGTTNAGLLRLVAQMEFARWFRHFDYYFRLPEERTASLRELLAKCIAASPERGEFYEILAWVEAAAPSPSIANVNLVQAKFPTLPNPARTLLPLATVRLRLGDRVTAGKLLDTVEELAPPKELRRIARELRDVMQREAELAAEAAGATPRS